MHWFKIRVRAWVECVMSVVAADDPFSSSRLSTCLLTTTRELVLPRRGSDGDTYPYSFL